MFKVSKAVLRGLIQLRIIVNLIKILIIFNVIMSATLSETNKQYFWGGMVNKLRWSMHSTIFNYNQFIATSLRLHYKISL